ncbi:plastocyanin/azurin family copper-binding protein [Pedobacter immunditicola]|uniref:plastocyanin/azurin family copper-binding protein n=1 Tax=Pedobacter immunditicola TaxID=3133440 RepID=UPI0030B76464
MKIFFMLMALTSTLTSSCSSPPDRPKTYTVEIKDMKFVPEAITVKKGDTVLWVNRDIMNHDVTEEKTKAWKSSPISTGTSWKMEVTNDANYYCSIHVVMKGTIRVE